MISLCGPFDTIKDITNVREAWRLKVRVIRVWDFCQTSDPSNVFSIEMVLVDAEGGRIQASIRRGMMKKFKDSIVEGGVYKMTYFRVIENGGDYRGTFHEFKLLFQPRTKVIPTENFIGVLTVVGEEKSFKKFGRDIRVLELELTDDK
ncbi:Nucleic acid-binding, OB-fold [Sesbania bispinosa]|nr:Nucleic acid-binding, OB-fold [Sesbania bispinosa]